MKKIPGTRLWIPDSDRHFTATGKDGRPVADTYQHNRVRKAIGYTVNRRTAIDVGAHVGLICRLLSREFKEVWAFEADPDNHACLVKNMDEYLCSNVHCNLLAVGSSEDKVGVDGPDSSNTGNRQIVPGGGLVDMVPLDSFKPNGSSWHGVDFVKIDVQGYEPYVLEGMVTILKEHKPVVQIEVEPAGKLARSYGKSPADAVNFLKGLGAKEVWREGADRVFSWNRVYRKGC